MEQQEKQILYDYQLLSLENRNPTFPITTGIIVRSGEIPDFRSGQSNETIANNVSNHIITYWNKTDKERAIKKAQNGISVLRRDPEYKIKTFIPIETKPRSEKRSTTKRVSKIPSEPPIERRATGEEEKKLSSETLSNLQYSETPIQRWMIESRGEEEKIVSNTRPVERLTNIQRLTRESRTKITPEYGNLEPKKIPNNIKQSKIEMGGKKRTNKRRTNKKRKNKSRKFK
jgi:hypothetical protein